MQLARIRKRLRDAGAKPKHEMLVLRAWLTGRALDAHAATHYARFPHTLLAALAPLATDIGSMAHVASEHPGEDGSARLLVELGDGQLVESVLLPREAVCVSTQIGCAVGCKFCMTGKSGLVRQLTGAEILAQVALARARRSVKRVVFMGMGEPAHNLDAVMEAITALGTEGLLGHKNLVFSTVGDARVFERLPEGPVKPALALSLHTTKRALREELLPRAPRIAPDELVERSEAYARRTTYPIQYQWTLLEGINDGDDELDRLTALMQGKLGYVNFIPYNTVEGLPYRRPTWERAAEMARHLHQHGVLAKLRRSAGQDVDGGCGQLRARSVLAPVRM